MTGEFISKKELLEAIGEEPIVENENDKTQIAIVLQYRKLMDIINNLKVYTEVDFYGVKNNTGAFYFRNFKTGKNEPVYFKY